MIEKVLITIKGGCVVDVVSNIDIKTKIIDFDNAGHDKENFIFEKARKITDDELNSYTKKLIKEYNE